MRSNLPATISAACVRSRNTIVPRAARRPVRCCRRQGAIDRSIRMPDVTGGVLGSASLRQSFGGALVFDPLLFGKVVGRQLVREGREQLPPGAGEPYREAVSLLSDDVCVHDAHPSRRF